MEHAYLKLLQDILDRGNNRTDRTGTGTRGLFGYQMRTNLQEGFPALTTKKIYMKSVIHELLWFLKGETNIKYLLDNNVHIWDQWTPAYKTGEPVGEGKECVMAAYQHEQWPLLELGPVYGKQWRRWQGIEDQDHWATHPEGARLVEIDQVQDVIDMIRQSPDSRRIIISAWNPVDIPRMGLPPCHCLVQFYVRDGKLDCQLYQRSADVLLGVPFNIASYSLLTHMIAQVCGLEAGDFIHTFGDVHIYNNHFDQVKEQLTREIRMAPKLWVNPEIKEINDFTFTDFELFGYDPHPPISAPIAV